MVANTHSNHHDGVLESGASGTGGSGGGDGATPPPPPSLTPEMFMIAMLGSQRNTKQSQRNMEDLLRGMLQNNNRDSHCRPDNEVNQYSNFKEF
jgi:hypothetical protein